MKQYLLWLLLPVLVLSLAGCGKEEEKPAETVPAETTVVTAPTEPLVEVIYYYGDENAEHLLSGTAQVHGLSPQNLLDLLGRKNLLPLGITVWEFSREDGILRLDVSRELGDYISQMGTAGEYIALGSLVNTFLANYDAEGLDLTVEGNPLETGHNIYDFTLRHFE